MNPQKTNSRASMQSILDGECGSAVLSKGHGEYIGATNKRDQAKIDYISCSGTIWAGLFF